MQSARDATLTRESMTDLLNSEKSEIWLSDIIDQY